MLAGLLAVFFSLPPIAQDEAPAINPKEAKAIYDRHAQSVALVRVFDADGDFLRETLGFFYPHKSGKLVVTNYHAVEGAASATAAGVSDDTGTFEFDGWFVQNRKRDLFIFKVKERGVPVGYRRGGKPKKGEPVVLVGDTGRPISGKITAIVECGGMDRSSEPDYDPRGYQPEYYLRHSAVSAEGYNGGALLDADGRLIGMNIRPLETDAGEDVGFGLAIPAEYIKEAIRAIKQQDGVVRRFTVEDNRRFDCLYFLHKLPVEQSDKLVKYLKQGDDYFEEAAKLWRTHKSATKIVGAAKKALSAYKKVLGKGYAETRARVSQAHAAFGAYQSARLVQNIYTQLSDPRRVEMIRAKEDFEELYNEVRFDLELEAFDF